MVDFIRVRAVVLMPVIINDVYNIVKDVSPQFILKLHYHYSALETIFQVNNQEWVHLFGLKHDNPEQQAVLLKYNIKESIVENTHLKLREYARSLSLDEQEELNQAYILVDNNEVWFLNSRIDSFSDTHWADIKETERTKERYGWIRVI